MQTTGKETGRRLIHTRKVQCRGYLRDDGYWDIEGQMEDTKTHDVQLAEGATVEQGQPYHGMMMRVTVDDAFVIREVDVLMLNVPTSQCGGAAAGYQRLIGECLGRGFARRIRELFGGTGGCVHLTELLLPIATTAFQTIPMARSLVAPRTAHDVQAYARSAAGLVNTCHALRSDGPIARKFMRPA